jgi:hypothetical protein
MFCTGRVCSRTTVEHNLQLNDLLANPAVDFGLLGICFALKIHQHTQDNKVLKPCPGYCAAHWGEVPQE